MSCAVEAVRRKGMAIREAARIFGVPQTTLNARVNGASSKRGRPSHFIAEEENQLAELMDSCARSGIAISPRILHKVVVNAALRKGM